MKKRSLALSLLAATLAFSVTAAHAAEKLKIGVAAMISPKETFKYYQDLLNYIGEKVGLEVELVQKPTYAEMDGLLKNEEVGVAFVCSGPYVKDKAEFGVELLVAPVSYGQPFYHAYIIVPKDSLAKAMSDLGGKKFAFTDPHSNTGYIVPTYMIGKGFSKTPEQFFKEIMFTKSHDKSIEAVAKKLADGAAVDSLIFDYAAKTNPQYTKETRILEKSPAYGIPPIVVTKAMDPAVKAKLRDAFLKVHEDPKGKEIISKIMVDKFIVPDDANYDSVREMEKWLKEFAKI
ncbi:MAG: phosphate/phosphite/phosphonate ABC transporter substrate-binding protein [Deltaproteobacteria bacterium]|nr:phosphate/phosphite/phosphonate ABC transporter substrate-binding protein [Deltaproteobacteria bacterium]